MSTSTTQSAPHLAPAIRDTRDAKSRPALAARLTVCENAFRTTDSTRTELRSIASGLSGRHRRVADQLGRAALAIPLLIAEGAHRRTTGQKRQRFTEARGECAEVAAACEVARLLALVDEDRAMRVEILADRVAAMLTRLIARQTP